MTMGYEAFKDTGGFDERVSMFTIWLKSGNAIAFPYFSMLEVRYDPSRGIEIPFATKQRVTLEGRKLIKLFQKLVRHEILEIFEANKAELRGEGDVERVVVK